MPLSPNELPPGIFFRLDIADPKERVQAYIDEYNMPHALTDGKGTVPSFDQVIMRNNLCCLSAIVHPPPSSSSISPTPLCTVILHLSVRSELCSRTGNLHGGAAALIFDMCTTMAVAPLATAEGWKFGGVSRNLNVSYLRPVAVGTGVRVICEVLGLGRSLATITAKILSTDGKLMAMAQHDKAWVDIAARSNKM